MSRALSAVSRQVTAALKFIIVRTIEKKEECESNTKKKIKVRREEKDLSM
jgi:hypothetical protein